MKQFIYILFVIFITKTVIAQQTPAPIQTEDFSIEGATAHLGNGEVIENSLIMFSQGKIKFVGSAKMKIARMGEIIDAKGKHLYPGFIAINSSLGLGEIDAVKATVDDREVGTILPHIRSIIAYNAESKIVESMRPNGVLLAQITPRGGTISGTSSIVQFDAWNWEDATVKADDGIHINWPSTVKYGKWWLGEAPSAKPDKNYAKNTQLIDDFFNDGKIYLKSNRIPKNSPFEAIEGLFNQTKTFYIHASDVQEIMDAIEFCKKHEIEKIVLVHGEDAHKISDVLVKNNIPVIIDRTHREPSRSDDDYDLPYKMAKILNDKGIMVAIGMEGQMERMNARNLPFYAGTAAAFGLDKEEALKLITSNAAKIVGIDADYGSIEVGKSATLFISEGDALDMRTNKLSHAFIDGRLISLETHQTELWKRYSKKYNSK